VWSIELCSLIVEIFDSTCGLCLVTVYAVGNTAPQRVTDNTTDGWVNNNGVVARCNLIYGDVSQLVGTDYNTMVSYSYSYWKDLAVEQYLKMQKAVGKLAGQKITNHMYLTEDVTLTQYEKASVIINYGTEVFVYEGKEIPAQGYLVI
jgi:hypothetical protein